MEYIIREELKKEKHSTAMVIASGFLTVIILNVLITMTNKLDSMQNIACIILLIIFGIIIFFITERIFSSYVYLLGDGSIGFGKSYGKKETLIIRVDLDEIKFFKKIEELQTNPNIINTYYFTYRNTYEDCYFCEYERNEKLYRFIFKPSERLIRILDRRINGNPNIKRNDKQYEPNQRT